MAVQFVQGSPLFTNINKVKKQYNYLTEDIDTEVIIVGGGVTGSILSHGRRSLEGCSPWGR